MRTVVSFVLRWNPLFQALKRMIAGGALGRPYCVEADYLNQCGSCDVAHHPFQAEIDHFVECLREGHESHCNLADAIKTHEVVFAARRCYRTGQPVRLPLN